MPGQQHGVSSQAQPKPGLLPPLPQPPVLRGAARDFVGVRDGGRPFGRGHNGRRARVWPLVLEPTTSSIIPSTITTTTITTTCTSTTTTTTTHYYYYYYYDFAWP